MRALITGINGFAAGHLVEHLLTQPDVEIWGCGLSDTLTNDLVGKAQYRRVDLRQPDAVHTLVEIAQPDQIYHLAAQSFVPASWEDPWSTLETNIRGQLNLFEAVRSLALESRILVVSSNEIYGQVVDPTTPVDEDQPFWPKNPYAVSKATQDMLARQYARHWGLHIVVARPFNHIGLRQNARFVAPAFARQVAAIELDAQPPVMKVGNLSSQRDFSDVRDVVRAYGLLMDRGEPGEAYNIGSGHLRPVQDILDTLLAQSTKTITIEVDPARLRKIDTPGMQVNVEKIKAATGWQVEIPFETTIRDLLDYERQRIRHDLEKTK